MELIVIAIIALNSTIIKMLIIICRARKNAYYQIEPTASRTYPYVTQ